MRTRPRPFASHLTAVEWGSWRPETPRARKTEWAEQEASKRYTKRLNEWGKSSAPGM